MFFSRAYRLTSEVSAARKPSSCVPPSVVEIVFAKVRTASEYAVVHCMATSAEMPIFRSSDSKSMTSGSIGVALRDLTM